jgi:hypothetical protein
LIGRARAPAAQATHATVPSTAAEGADEAISASIETPPVVEAPAQSAHLERKKANAESGNRHHAAEQGRRAASGRGGWAALW